MPELVSMTKRLFIGTLLSPEQRRLLSDLKAELAPVFAQSWVNCKLRFVKPEKLHITWLFIGDCQDGIETVISKILASRLAGISPVSLQYEQLEIFGSKTRPRALVLSSGTAQAEIQELGTLIRKNLGHFCQKKEDLSFRPHLTLARFPHGYRQATALKPELDLIKYLPLKQDIACVSLIESHYGTQKDSYERLADFPLLAL